ncbi:MAG TPA: N-6 DNA methylase [Thermoanaerobaculia bacterium]|nr:N-6 DNA methylase [Thermoanaerobaculia bacterium]HUM31160.1 N-6 DNA methylase [Thermoanaerobaculia bacterium]HXK69540.1 N-6 DNA methylase [Thermoanaerobaculia bacterium]
MANNTGEIEKRLWGAADELRANSRLKASEYSIPVLGLIFLRYADSKFTHAHEELEGKSTGRKQIGKADYQAKGVLYLPEPARFVNLLKLPEGGNIGQAINDAMKAIEAENPDLKDVLPKTYNRLENATLVELLKLMASIPMDIEGDAFGKIYEYFLGNFARAEGQKGGEFFTPTSIVKLIVEIIEPFHGRIFDPACGSGGMFVQSARFVQEHKQRPTDEISVYGEERVAETVRLCKMNLAVHGLAGDIRQGNTYYEDLHNSKDRFDFVMANPPFNVDRIDKERLRDDKRFPFGLPRTDNGNYIWIQIFASALNEKGRAGFVMANSASDARSSELEIRKQMIEDHLIDVMVAVGSNFFYTVTLPCTLWFLDREKALLPPCPPSPGPLGHPLPAGEGNSVSKASLPPGPHFRGGFDFSDLVKQARELRKKQTPAEELFWQLVRNRQFMDLKFRRQHQIGDYIVDFYCPEANLIIELDGSVHEKDSRQKIDKKRDAYLTSVGNKVIRIKNEDLIDSTQDTLHKISENLPSPPGRGVRGEGKQNGVRSRDTVLFIDARHTFRQIDRAHRDFEPAQLEFLANIVRLYRGEEPEDRHGSKELMETHFPDGTYVDVPGLCKVATVEEIEAQGWSLNPGRYVGVAVQEDDGVDFKERLQELNDELQVLNAEARELEDRISDNVMKLLETDV